MSLALKSSSKCTMMIIGGCCTIFCFSSLPHNHITLEACQHLAEILKNDIKVSALKYACCFVVVVVMIIVLLRLASNKFKDEGMEVICDALSENSTVNSIQYVLCL